MSPDTPQIIELSRQDREALLPDRPDNWNTAAGLPAFTKWCYYFTVTGKHLTTGTLQPGCLPTQNGATTSLSQVNI